MKKRTEQNNNKKEITNNITIIRSEYYSYYQHEQIRSFEHKENSYSMCESNIPSLTFQSPQNNKNNKKPESSPKQRNKKPSEKCFINQRESTQWTHT